ncbi:MAG TPA: efflux RND transporter periplasmic adaptor subunit [Bryobacteraceae bacterium]|jgi:RND family efflux transporter MFP subunit|nr:efflux RND transporter periplasmic adaptor subunit [Bryobacteraceae bacterium]
MKTRIGALVGLALCLGACSKTPAVRAGSGNDQETVTTVGVTPVTRKTLERQLTISSELVPYQETDVFAKESGYVKDLLVDYGSRVTKGQLMAVLEIPELEMQLKQDAAAISNAQESVTHAQHEVDRLEAQHVPVKAQADRLASVAKTRPGLVAQQEVDDAQGKDLALEAQVEAGKSAYQSAKSQLDETQAKLERDKVMFDYARITAPFAGVVTQRYANQGTLMQAGTNSSTQATPLVRLSEDDIFRLVIPVPETYVKFIRVGDPVQVRVTSLDKVFTGTVKRFSDDIAADTRTMHTEVELQNSGHILMPGLYAEATLTLEKKNSVLSVPLQSVSQSGDQATVFVVDDNNTIDERKVVLGLQTSTDAEVVSGVKQGDRVVISDRSGLKPGLHVKPQVIAVPQDSTH